MTEGEGEGQSAAVMNVIAGGRDAVTLYDSSIIFLFLSLSSVFMKGFFLFVYVEQYLSLDRSFTNEKIQESLIEYEMEI